MVNMHVKNPIKEKLRTEWEHPGWKEHEIDKDEPITIEIQISRDEDASGICKEVTELLNKLVGD